MAQKLLLFWRKPARRCWWEGVELHDVEGVPGKLKVWIRRVWTLEMVSHSARIVHEVGTNLLPECHRSEVICIARWIEFWLRVYKMLHVSQHFFLMLGLCVGRSSEHDILLYSSINHGRALLAGERTGWLLMQEASFDDMVIC